MKTGGLQSGFKNKQKCIPWRIFRKPLQNFVDSVCIHYVPQRRRVAELKTALSCCANFFHAEFEKPNQQLHQICSNSIL